jgi:hypothetical protein
VGVQNRTVEALLGELAARSHGVVTRGELLRAGVTVGEIGHQLRIRALLREHRGVYRVGHRAPSLEARNLAAVRACGQGALLSGRAAAHHLGILKGPALPPEVTTPTERRVAGVRTRRSRGIEAEDRMMYRGIPVTSVARTLVDLAGSLSADDLARACHEAGVRYRTTPSQVRQVDCRWPDRRLTVELDSYRYHQSRHAWDQDRRRERGAHARGDEFRRYTYGDVFEAPQQMLAGLPALLP